MEELFKSIIEKSNDAILVVSDSTIVYLNEMTAKLCGYGSPDEIMGKNAFEFLPKGYRSLFMERMRSRLEGKPQPIRFDHEILRRDGSTVPVETTAAIIEYGGKPAVLFIGRDITERKRFEEKLFALHQYAAQLGAAQTLVEITESTLEAVTSVMGRSYAHFMLREDDERFGCVKDVGYDEQYWDVPIVNDDVIGRSVKEAHTFLANDVDEGVNPHLRDNGVQAQLVTPVIIRGRVEAVISIESLERGSFTASDAQILEIIAQHASSALERIE